jgi:hypothetical protein
MAGMSPLRRRMIEDMTVPSLSPATNDHMLLPGSAASSAVHLTSLIRRTSEHSRFTWSLAGYQPARTRPSVHFAFSTGSRSSRQTCQSGSRMRGSHGGCPWCWVPMKS